MAQAHAFLFLFTCYYLQFYLVQQVLVLSVAALSTMLVFIALQKHQTRSKMRELGYKGLDQMSYVNQLFQDNNLPVTIFGFEFADSRLLTWQHAQAFAQQLTKTFINFRSHIINKHGTYYLKETETFDINKCVNYIKLDLETIDINISEDTDECIIQHAVNYVNKHNLINVDWNAYDRPNWDMFYLHYPKHNRCFLFFRCNHVIIDGLFASTCIASLQLHLWGNNTNHKALNRNNIDNILQQVVGQSSMKKTWWHSLYMLATSVPSFIGIVGNTLGIKPDPICSINGKKSSWTGVDEWALGSPIPIDEFKNIAHAHGGTVNDFFLLLCSKAIKAYMQLQKDTSDIVDINAVGIKSTRGLDTMEDQFMEYCVRGAHANQLMYIPYFLPIQKCSMELIQSRFAKVKYGLSGWWTMQLSRLLTLLPVFVLTHWIVAAGGATTFTSSNLIASEKPWPLPAIDKKDTKDKRNTYVKCAFGQSTAGPANMNFTVVTYNGHIRLGVAAEIGSVSNTRLLMKCFMDQYRLHAN
eukprot:430220_1